MTSPSRPETNQQSLVGTDVLCELAHALTVRECTIRAIPVDEDREDEVGYTDAAYLVFQSIYDIASSVLERRGAEVAP